MPESPDDELAIGSTVGRYTIVRKLGSGGMGAVYEATHQALKRRVAIKTLRRGLAHSPDILARFVREGEAASRLRHPHVVDVTDVGIEAGIPYLVMEYLDGEDLAALLAREKRLSPARIAELMLPVCAAVATAHADGIVHRDLKPANIFLARTRVGTIVVKLLDFGISKIANATDGANLTGSSVMLGTAAYMSPEQARGGRDVEAASDQYSLGAVLYECVVGQRAHAHAEASGSLYGLLHAIVEGDIPPPRSIAPDVPAAFEAVILRAMQKEPSRRYSSVLELGVELLRFATPAVAATWETTFFASAGLASTMAASPHDESPRLAQAPSHVTSPQTTMSGAARMVAAPAHEEATSRSRPRQLSIVAAVAVVAALTSATVWYGRTRWGQSSPESTVSLDPANRARVATAPPIAAQPPTVTPAAPIAIVAPPPPTVLEPARPVPTAGLQTHAHTHSSRATGADAGAATAIATPAAGTHTAPAPPTNPANPVTPGATTPPATPHRPATAAAPERFVD